MHANRYALVIAVSLGVLGVLSGFWPFLALCLALCAIVGDFLVALALGLVCDIVYGAPMGLTHFLFFPFTLGACALCLVALGARRYFFEHEDGHL